ncbi:MAG: Hpt domain-containing protein [Ignavibacteriota bacterium]
MDGYLPKPLRLVALERAIEERIASCAPAAMTPAKATACPEAKIVLFNPEEFDESVMGNEDLARRILQRFVDDMPRQLSRLAQAVSDGDAAQARLLAHSIKGAAASVSGLEMREASWKLEQQARDGNLAVAAEAVRELSESFERTRPVMKSFCEGCEDD